MYTRYFKNYYEKQKNVLGTFEGSFNTYTRKYYRIFFQIIYTIGEYWAWEAQNLLFWGCLYIF